MKSELRLSPHSTLPGETVVEVWWQGAMVATVYGADDPGVRVISKHPLSVSQQPSARHPDISIVQVLTQH